MRANIHVIDLIDPVEKPQTMDITGHRCGYMGLHRPVASEYGPQM